MLISKYTQMSYFEIWEPRYRDKKVLLAKRKVGTHNKIIFTRAPSMGTEPYYISGAKVKKYKLEGNGRIPVYAVPISELEPLEIGTRDIREVL